MQSTLLKIIVLFIVTIFFYTCSKDDTLDSVTFNACDGIEQSEEVTVFDVEVSSINTDNQRGYLVRASINNNTTNTIDNGRVIITFIANNNPITFNSIGDCSSLMSNSNCDYLRFLPIASNESLDESPVVACFYYQL